VPLPAAGGAELPIRGLLNPFQRLKESITDRPA
jgi:hypothetical protein